MKRLKIYDFYYKKFNYKRFLKRKSFERKLKCNDCNKSNYSVFNTIIQNSCNFIMYNFTNNLYIIQYKHARIFETHTYFNYFIYEK